jgi:hypothetical protein
MNTRNMVVHHIISLVKDVSIPADVVFGDITHKHYFYVEVRVALIFVLDHLVH